MDSVTQLNKINKKLSEYQSPKVNWLNKRPFLLYTLSAVCAVATFVLLLSGFFSVVSAPVLENALSQQNVSQQELIAFAVFVLTLIPVCSVWVFLLCAKKVYPQQKKAIKKYTGAIVKGFREEEFYDIKIKLLKILNNEPHTPVNFLDKIFYLKSRWDYERQLETKQSKGKTKSSVVTDVSALTVLIEEMEQDKNDELIKKSVDCKKRAESIAKL